jgi:cellulose synthase operon protein C
MIFRTVLPDTNRTSNLCGLPPPHLTHKKGFRGGPPVVAAFIATVTALIIPLPRLAHAQSRTEQAAVEKARSLESRGLTDLAAQTWHQVLLSQPNNTEALTALAQAARRQGNDAEAARYVQRLRQINPNNPQIATIESTVTSKVHDARRAQAEALAASRDYVGAMQIYRQLYGDNPPSDSALEYYETEAGTEAGRSHAIAGLRSLAKLHPGEERYQATLGRVLTYNPRTRAEGERILQQPPQNAEAQAALRQALQWDAQNPGSAGTIKRYLNLHPDAELAQDLQQTQTRQKQRPRGPAGNSTEQAAYAALAADDVSGAERGFRAVLERDPANARSLAGLGFVHMKQANFTQAVSDFEAARRNGSKDPAVDTALDTAHFWLIMAEGAKALDGFQVDLAAQRYRQALTMRPSSPEALAALAGTLVRARQSAEAAEIYARWVRVQPNSTQAWHGLFTAEVQAGQTREALELARRFPPDVDTTLAADPAYLLALAEAYRTVGDDATCQQILEQALNLPFPEGGRRMSPDLQMQYAAVLAANGHQEQAASLYDQVAAELLAQQATTPSNDLELQIAGVERQRNHLQAAATFYRRVLASDPHRADAWKGLLSTLHQSGADAQALAEAASIPSQTHRELSGDDDYLLTLSAIYSATGHPRWTIATLARLRARYAAQHQPAPIDVDIQSSWLLFSSGDEPDLYSTLMRLGGRDDLLDGQRRQVQSIWAAWSLRRAAQSTAAGNTRNAIKILNAARDALGGNPAVSSSLAGGYLTAGDAPAALAIYRSLDLTSAEDYQGAVRAALAMKDLKLAESWLRQGLEIYRRDGGLLGLAAQFEQARGDNGRAREYWKASLAVSPDTGAGDRLAHTLLTPVAGPRDKGRLLSGDKLASLLGADADWASRTNVLPGEADTARGMFAEASDPYPDAPPVGRRGERLGDYGPAIGRAQANYDSPPAVGASSLQTATTATTSRLTPVYPAIVTRRRRHLVRRNQVPAPVPQPAPVAQTAPLRSTRTGAGLAVDSVVDEGRWHVAREALSVAGSQSDPMPLNVNLNRAGANPEFSQRELFNRDAGGKLTLRYASAVQEGAPQQPQRAAPPQEIPREVPQAPREVPQAPREVPQAPREVPKGPREAPQTPGLTDQQLIDSELPPLRGNYVPSAPSQNANQEAREQIEAIDGGLSAWVGGTGAVRHRSGTAGYDKLTALEVPFEASTRIGMNARLTGIISPVILDNGLADGTSALMLGTAAVGAKPAQQYGDGVAEEVQLTAFNFAARVGQTPNGFLVNNITGGVRWRPLGGPLTFVFSRDGSKETQLAYSGMRDPGSATATFAGNIWGGVMINAGDVQIAHGSALSGFYAGVGGQYITGRHVLINNRFHGNAGAYWRLLTRPNYGSLVLEADFFDMHYAHNIRYFTYGQGGYFSPQAYTLAAVPLTWAGHYGSALHYKVRGSVGVQAFHEDSEPFYPLDAKLQAAAGNPLEPILSTVGANYDLQGEIAYRVQDHWYIGGFVDASNTRDYLSQSGGFFVRYLFRPQPELEAGPIGAFPRDGFRPVLVP